MLSWTWIARSCYGPAGRLNADEPSSTGPVQIYLLARQPNASTFSTRSSRNGTNESKLRRIDTISVAFPENGFLISFSPSFIKETITNIPTYQDGWNNVEEKIIRWVNFFFFPLNRKIYIYIYNEMWSASSKFRNISFSKEKMRDIVQVRAAGQHMVEKC